MNLILILTLLHFLISSLSILRIIGWCNSGVIPSAFPLAFHTSYANSERHFTLKCSFFCVCLLLSSIVCPPFVASPSIIPFCCFYLAIFSSPRGWPSYPWHQIPVDARKPRQCCTSSSAVSFSHRAEPCSRGALSQREFPPETMGSLPG